MKHLFLAIILFLACLNFQPLKAATITYFESDFEDGGLGGATGFGLPFSTPVNVQAPELDGRGLLFPTNAQAQWRFSGPSSNLHRVGFDFFALSGANVTMFFDVPSILRTDVKLEGHHRLEVFYDLTARSIEPYLDGVLSPKLLGIAAWPSNFDIRGVRIANQVLSPGNSTGAFRVDKFIWQGGVTASDVLRPKPVPDSGNTLALLAIASMALGFLRIHPRLHAWWSGLRGAVR
jgi:hypothetical protein